MTGADFASVPGRFLDRGHPLQRWEPAMGFASRLAILNGRELPTLLRDMRIDLNDLAGGQEQAIMGLREIRSLGTADLESMRRYTPRRALGERAYSVAGEKLLPGGVASRGARICPHCIAEDLDAFKGPVAARPWLRLEWVLTPIRACSRHRTLLLDIDPIHRLNVGFDFSTTIARQVLPDLARWQTQSTAQAGAAFTDWVITRLDGTQVTGNLLDDAPLYSGMAFCRDLGVAMMRPPGTRLCSLTPSELAEMTELGFRVAVQGEKTVAAALDEMVSARLRKKRGTAGPEKVYGHLYLSLRRSRNDPAFRTFCGIVREHAFSTLPLSPGTDILGVHLDRRRVHSQRTAALSASRTDAAMLRILGLPGNAPSIDAADAGKRVMIPVDEFNDIIVQTEEFLSTKQVYEITGFGSRRIDDLVAAGLLRVLPEDQRFAGAYYRFLRADVDALMACLFRDAQTVSEPDGPRIPVGMATRVGRVSVIEVISAIHEGRLAWVGHCGKERTCRNLLVDADEIGTLRQGRTALEGLTVKEVVSSIPGIRPGSVPRLVEAGLLERKPEYHAVSTRTVHLVTKSSVIAFTSEFATIDEISGVMSLPPRRAMRRLSGLGVVAIRRYSEVQTTLYRRSDVSPHMKPTEDLDP